MDSGTSVKVAVRIRPLSAEESAEDETLCINAVVGEPQVFPNFQPYLVKHFQIDGIEYHIFYYMVLPV